MAAGNEIREFLTTRRGRITPEQAGLRSYGTRRRVTGLRREEVAMLAGISVEYYTQLERGAVTGVSEDVLDAVARALQLNEVERIHLIDLVRAAKQRPSKRRKSQPRLRPGVQQLLDSMTDAAAFIRNSRLDILSANRLGYALYSEAFSHPIGPPTSPGSSSSTLALASSTSTGTESPTQAPEACAPPPAATPTTAS